MSPLAAVRDLRAFLARRQAYELWFLLAAMVLTAVVLAAFVKDSHVESVYKPDIIYVQQWPANRSEADIMAQRKIDNAAKAKEQAALKKQQDANRAKFQRLDQQLDKLGL